MNLIPFVTAMCDKLSSYAIHFWDSLVKKQWKMRMGLRFEQTVTRNMRIVELEYWTVDLINIWAGK